MGINTRVRKLEDRVVVLEEALRQAQETVSFLHGCLMHPDHYFYLQPDDTTQHLADWQSLLELETQPLMAAG